MSDTDPPTPSEDEHGPPAEPAPAAPLEVGVRLAPAADVAEWLREAEAYETAGAHALWIGDPEPGMDAGALVAALAAVTYRAMLVLVTARAPEEPVLATIQAIGRDRLVVPEAEGVLPEGRRWADVAVPRGRAAWRESLREAAEAGAVGVVVPAGPRLLDILRNPADPEGRQDLHLSFG
ncbi:MAG: hypothetical protein GEV11_07500 [Streptosporangiales bacterium]|nr:hypothetical protein [Streptosporangiales bacterium]